MTEYVTTNIRLPRDIYRKIKRRALEEEKSLAQVIRESIAQYLIEAPAVPQQGDEPQEPADAWESDTLWLIGRDATIADVTDGSIHHDAHLYGPLSEAASAELKD